jgi:DNA replication protein DnaC
MSDWDLYCGVKWKDGINAGRHCSRSHWSRSQLIEHLEIDHGMSISDARIYLDNRSRRFALSKLANGRDRMAEWSFDTFPAQDAAGRRALKTAREWIEDYEDGSDSGLYIWGPVGSGKTGLAYSVARDNIERYPGSAKDVHFINVRAWLAEGRARISGGEQPEIEHLLDSGGDGSLVVLDDLGAERPTDWALEQIAYVVENRHAVDACTVVTTNYAPSQLAERLGRDDPVIGQRIVSRLLEKATKIELKRADLRVRKSAA